LTDAPTKKTIPAEHARDLYALFDDHGVIDDNPPLDDTSVAHDWLVLGSTLSRISRWHERYWMLLRNADDEVWGLEYGVGLTEDQEDDLPWEHARGELPLTRLYPYAVTTVEYRTKPPKVDAELVNHPV
jgi:hypothetical protein